MTEHVILAIDQGTTSSRAMVFDERARVLAASQQEFPQVFPRPGWVEHDPEAIWQSVVAVMHDALADAGCLPRDVACIGITNQRETTVVWDRRTGAPVYNAIVWQDRRTAAKCREYAAGGGEELATARSGLRIDPYFSATKLAWILDNVEGARERAERGELAFGTIDTFLLWRLTAGAEHRTDITNASRTLLYDIHRQCWDEDLLAHFGIPASLLPEVCDNACDFGTTDVDSLGAAMPVTGMAGDQQAALFGQACFHPGMTKSTYGTGCFVIANTGDKPLASGHQLLTTIASRLDGRLTYGLEGSIFVAGSAIQWLRDALKIIAAAPDSEAIAEAQGVIDNIHVVPAFAGLGAPHWDPDARGAILGLSRDTGVAEIVTATLQSVAFQTRDLMLAMRDDGLDVELLRVDGGMVTNDWLVQFLADMLGITVERPRITESTAFGAACLAGLQRGVFDSLEQLERLWQRDALFEPDMPAERRRALHDGWLAAIARVRSAAQEA
ncbi:MAG: glycerol kinase GlpK [Gammaproteobacteria bacterium]|jgi:glycerol kinase|nr:glycerol kinase GlpK [Gammaproteobacteria bacterium]